MANQTLIKGAYMGPQHAGLANYYLNSQNDKLGRGRRNYGNNYPDIPYKHMQNFLNSKVDKYIDNLPAGYEVEKLPQGMRNGVTNWSKSMQIQAGNWARNMKKTKPGSTAYIQAQAGFQNIKNQFKNISSNLDQFKVLKTEFLKDYDSKTISEGSDTDQLKMLFSSDNLRYSLLNGNVTFDTPDGGVIDGNNLPKYFNKNSDGANKLIKLNEGAYKNGNQWDQPTESHYKRSVLNIVREQGREGLLSLATDQFLDEPIINKDHPNSWLLKEENHDDLEKYVVDQYVQGMKSASETAYQNKAKKATTNNGGGGNISSGPLVAVETRDSFWESGELSMITNEPGWPTDHEVVDNKDGTFDVVKIRKNGSSVPVGKNLDPTNADHKRYWDNIIGGGTSSTAQSPSSIDPNQI